MKDSFLALIEVQEVFSGTFACDIIQQAITAWLTTQLNTPFKGCLCQTFGVVF